MKIPCYDDLTPSISNVHPRDTFDFAARLVPPAGEPVVRVRQGAGRSGEKTGAPAMASASGGGPAPLYACIRSVGPARPGGILALAREFSPRIEREGDAAVVLDVSGLGRLLGDAPGIAAELERTAADHGLQAAIALAPTMTGARLLTLQRGAPAVVLEEVSAALAPVPLDTLRTLAVPDASAPGADARVKIFETLRRWGLRTIGELAALPPDEIAARFSAPGVALQRLARGADLRPLLPDPGVPRFIESMALEWPIEALEPLSFVLARLLEPLSLALERAGKGGVAVRLDLRLVDRTTHTRQLQLPAPMRDARVLRTLLLLDLESHPPAAGIDVVTIEIDPAPGRVIQFSLLDRATPSPETIATLTARLGALVGEAKCGSPVLLDTYRPDAFEMGRFHIEPVRPRGIGDRSMPIGDGPVSSGGPPPTAVRGAMEPYAASLRRFRPPGAIRVAVERGRPVHIPIDRKGMPGGRVVQAAGPWRSSGDWWDATGRHWDRDEWDVELADGTVCRLFQVRDTGGWFLEGVVD